MIADFKWSQPPNQKSGSEPKNTESKIGAPEPRANCSATFHKNKVYIFGGHGGINYQRMSFNDFHVFDCETSEWTKLENIEGLFNFKIFHQQISNYLLILPKNQ